MRRLLLDPDARAAYSAQLFRRIKRNRRRPRPALSRARERRSESHEFRSTLCYRPACTIERLQQRGDVALLEPQRATPVAQHDQGSAAQPTSPEFHQRNLIPDVALPGPADSHRRRCHEKSSQRPRNDGDHPPADSTHLFERRLGFPLAGHLTTVCGEPERRPVCLSSGVLHVPHASHACETAYSGCRFSNTLNRSDLWISGSLDLKGPLIG